MMPYSENPHFVGREEICENVKRTLQSTSRGQKRVALYGLGGVGQVLRYCQQLDVILTIKQQQIPDRDQIRFLVPSELPGSFAFLDTQWNF